MINTMTFGETVEGIDIPVVNEREVRAAAGILFVFALPSFMVCQLTNNFVMLKYVITVFFIDMLIRVFVNPKYAPSLILGRFMVRNQTPEYVGAKPKRFAWAIGAALATLLFTMQVAANVVTPVTGLTCFLCLIFLFFEASFGICLGCMVYTWITKDKAQLCPGDVCEDKPKTEIQTISMTQIFILIGFALFIASMVYFFHDFVNEKPYDVFGILSK